MKKTMLRLICLALAVFMVFGVAGCKSNNTSSFGESTGDFNLDFNGNDTGSQDDVSLNESAVKGKGNATKAETIADADSLSLNQLLSQIPSSLRGTTITFYNWNPVKEFTGAEAVISKFEKQTGIKVNWTTGGYDDYDSKIAAMINSGSSPDIIRFKDPSIHRMYLCDDIKTATGYDCKGAVWDSKLTSKYTVKGKIYAVNLKDTLFNEPYVFIYKKSKVDKYKLEDPYAIYKSGNWTWDRFISMCKQFKEFETGDDPWRTNTGIDYLNFSGKHLFTFDGSKYTNNLSSPEISDGIKKMCEYRKNEYIGSALRLPKHFEEGKMLFMTYSAICLRKTNAWFTSVKADGDLYAVPIPSIPGVNGTSFSELEAYGVCKGAKNGAAAYYFLRYFLDASNYDPNTFFCNKQAYDVYKDCMAKSEYYVSTDASLIDIVGEGGNLAGLSKFVVEGGDFAQFNSERDRVMPTYNLAVKKANEVLDKFS